MKSIYHLSNKFKFIYTNILEIHLFKDIVKLKLNNINKVYKFKYDENIESNLKKIDVERASKILFVYSCVNSVYAYKVNNNLNLDLIENFEVFLASNHNVLLNDVYHTKINKQQPYILFIKKDYLKDNIFLKHYNSNTIKKIYIQYDSNYEIQNWRVNDKNYYIKLYVALSLALLVVFGFVYFYFDTLNSDDEMLSVLHNESIEKTRIIDDSFVQSINLLGFINSAAYVEINNKIKKICIKDSLNDKYFVKNIRNHTIVIQNQYNDKENYKLYLQ